MTKRTAVALMILGLTMSAYGADCPLGTASPNGQNLPDPCTPCAAGTFASDSGSIVCMDCSPGFFSAHVGSSTCVSCPPESYAPDPGAVRCLACQSQPLPGQATCPGIAVPAGSTWALIVLGAFIAGGLFIVSRRGI